MCKEQKVAACASLSALRVVSAPDALMLEDRVTRQSWGRSSKMDGCEMGAPLIMALSGLEFRGTPLSTPHRTFL